MAPDTLGYVGASVSLRALQPCHPSEPESPFLTHVTEASSYRIVRNEPIMASTLRTWADLFYRIGLEWIGGDSPVSARSVRILAPSSYDDQEYVHGLPDGDASGSLTEKMPALVVEAVRAVADGRVRWFVRPDRNNAQAGPE
ncbi:MAG: hypothetical protein BRD35_01340 [Bacteroidetes bacterium QH_7_62_13]|nr:MAG: hypothetical protein BRD35_01340 [Bacteroidetes bacterium QH_7_62_13]